MNDTEKNKQSILIWWIEQGKLFGSFMQGCFGVWREWEKLAYSRHSPYHNFEKEVKQGYCGLGFGGNVGFFLAKAFPRANSACLFFFYLVDTVSKMRRTMYYGWVTLLSGFFPVMGVALEDSGWQIFLNQMEKVSEWVVLDEKKSSWIEFDQFKEQLFLTVALDPTGPYTPQTPDQYKSTHLTDQLVKSWNKISFTRYQLWREYQELNSLMRLFLDLRKQTLYQKARSLLKSGELIEKIRAFENRYRADRVQEEKADHQARGRKMVGFDQLQAIVFEQQKQQAVRYAAKDPMLSIMDQKVASRVVPQKEKKGQHLWWVGVSVVIFGLAFCTASGVMWRRRVKVARATKANALKGPLNGMAAREAFDYTRWLIDLHDSIEEFKRSESMHEHRRHILQGLLSRLKESHQSLTLLIEKNFGSGDMWAEDLQARLVVDAEKRIGSCIHAFERHLQESTQMSSGRFQKRIIRHLLSLCSAVESNQKISFQREMVQ